jgi:hypothetical protein
LVAEVDAVRKHVRKARLTAQRVVQRTAAGTLGRHEVDVAGLLFGHSAVEAKLARHGLLEDGGHCDALVSELSAVIASYYRTLAPVDALAGEIAARLNALRARPDPFPSRKPAAASTRDRAERIEAQARASAARLLAVHLCQRAMYEAVDEVVRGFVAAQMDGLAEDRHAHGLVAMGPAQVEDADEVIDKVRRGHAADRPVRRPVTPVHFLSGGAPIDVLSMVYGDGAGAGPEVQPTGS